MMLVLFPMTPIKDFNVVLFFLAVGESRLKGAWWQARNERVSYLEVILNLQD